MIIMGIDPGTASCGYGVIEVSDSGCEYITSGIIQTVKENTDGIRLAEIFTDISQLCASFVPNEVAVESLFFSKNISSCIQVAQARGAIFAAISLWRPEVVIKTYNPKIVKNTVTGNGNATKPMMRKAIMQHLAEDIKDDNAVDGLCIALCHYTHHRLLYKPKAKIAKTAPPYIDFVTGKKQDLSYLQEGQYQHPAPMEM
jgi:crossover junction endodeoxyribonuclease RuvC